MATTADVKVTPGSGANVATYSVTEDTETKQIQRIAINDSTGVEIDPAKETGGNLDAIKADTDTIATDIATVVTNTNKIPASPAEEGGNLASIKTDLDTHVAENATLVEGQTKIATTGTAVQLASNVLKNGVIITAKSSNAAPLSLGGSGVNNTVDGTGNGQILEAGKSIFVIIPNTDALYLNGTAGDICSFIGS